MQIREVADKKTWNEFVANNGPRSGAFLHSWEWGEFQAAIGRKVRRVGIYEGDQQIAAALVVEHVLPAGQKYIYCPRGPIFYEKKFKAEILNRLASKLGSVSGSIFFRFEPPVEQAPTLMNSRVRPTVSVQPKETLLLDLAKGAESLLKEMHQKTRYNIRLASKKGVKVKELGFDQFGHIWDLFKQTAKRNEFRLHESSHYKELFNQFSRSGEPAVRFIGAYFEDDLIATVINVDFAGTRVYLHGASSDYHRNVMAPFAIHWHEIEDAIKRGYLWYDFWGVSDINPNWKGITRFKRGFGGEELKYPGTFDFVLNKPKYLMYSWIRRFVYGSRY